MTDGAMLTEILTQLEIPCDKYSFHGKLDALAAGLGIDTEGRLLGDVLDDIAAKEGIQRDNRLYGAFIRKLYDYVTNGEDVMLTGNPLVLANSVGRPLKECVVSWEPEQEGSGEPYPAGGGKNKLPFPANSTKYPQSRNGLTVTANADGSYTINGTATADTWFNICSLYGKGFDDFGAFALSGCPNGGPTSTAYYLALYTGTKWYSDTGDGTTGQIGTLTAGARIEISIKAGYVATNLRVCPQLEHGSTVTAYAPYANIRPIHGRDSVTVERCGENLLPFGEHIENIYVQQIMASDDLLLLSKACAEQELTLTFTVETQNLVFKDTEEEWRKRIGFECHGTLADGTEVYTLQCWFSDSGGELTKNGKKTKTVTVTMPKLVNGNITFYAQNIMSGSFVAYDFGIYAGTTVPTTYTPYIGQTNTLTLPSTVYGGEVDAVTDAGKETWALLTLDGTENWNTWGVNANNSAVTGFYTYGINDYDAENVKGICSNLPHPDGDPWGGRNSGIGFATVGSSRYFMYCIPTAILADVSDNSAAIASLKSYLAAQYAAGTPVQIAYKIATPAPFSATGGGSIPTVKGTNTLLTDADTIKATYRCNVRAAEQELDTLYTDLLQELEA